MAKSSTIYSPSKLGIEIPSTEGDNEFDSGSNSTYNLVKNKVQLRSLIDSRLEYRGQVTGELYTWSKAGSIVEVDEDDSIILLEKRLSKRPCCGGSKGGYALFEKV